MPRSTATPGILVPLPSFAASMPDSWQPMFDRARAADAAGIRQVVVSDHVVFGENLEAYADPSIGGTKGGKQPTGPDGVWLDPLTVLSMVAAQTRRVRLATGILIVALRRAAVLAKAASTLDLLSGGRLELGVGVGWQREEYEAAGLAFDGRGALLDESLAVLQALWRDLPASFDGERLQFKRIYCVPQPVQPGGVPINVSGTLNKRVLSRIARYGSGWIPWGPDIEEVTRGVARVHEALQSAGRDPSGFRVWGQLHLRKDDAGGLDLRATMESVASQLEAGVTDFRYPGRIPDEYNAAVDFLSQLQQAFDAAVA